jgi:hypothetical protein
MLHTVEIISNKQSASNTSDLEEGLISQGKEAT